jgi:probable F420-dependent oxidoreductase
VADAPRIAVSLPQLVRDDGAAARLADYAARAEEMGFSGLWVLDSAIGSATSHMPLLDGLHSLTYVSSATSSIGLGIAVIVMPRRNATLLAKELATVDRLSGGRLVVGVGLGQGDADPGLAFPSGRRVRRLAEGVEVIRALWSQDRASFEGEVYRFADMPHEPKPAQRLGPPIWFGAGKPPALRRAARMADGWIGAGSSSSSDFVEQSRIVDAALAELGREGFPRMKRVYIAIEEDAARAEERLTPVLDGMYGAPGMTERCGLCGTPEQCAEELATLVEAGASQLMLNPLYDEERHLEAFAEIARLLART